MSKFFFLLIAVLFSVVLTAQDNQPLIDSLENVYGKTSDPKTKIDLKMEIEELRYNFDADLWIKLAEDAHKIIYTEAEAKCLNNVGFILSSEGKPDEAITYYQKALDLYRKINSIKGMAGTYNDLGAIYHDIKETEKCLEYYKKSNELYLKSGDSLGISLSSHNMSTIYAEQKDFAKSKEYALKSLTISRSIRDYQGLPSILQNLGTILEQEGNADSALILYREAYSVSVATNFPPGIAYTGISIGTAYYSVYTKGLKEDLIQPSKLDSAKFYLLQSYTIGEQIMSPDIRKRASQQLMRVYATEKDWEKAFTYSKRFYELKDTLTNTEKQKEILRSQLEYEHNLEKLKTEEENKAQQAVAEEKAKRQFFIIVGAGILVVLLILFSIVIIRRWKLSQHQKLIIGHQKEIVEEKQKEIIDSINYAQRIQNAILPSMEEWNKNLSDSFILYKPKDIVAGDFYWMETIPVAGAVAGGSETHLTAAAAANCNLIFIAAADCTGHGVPGAMVSVICSNALNKCVLELGITEPGKILDKTRELVIERFAKSGKEVKDGMDISLCCFTFDVLSSMLEYQQHKTNNIKDKTLHWSGANNPLWIIKNNTKEVIEIGGDKQPIGYTENPQAFTTHEVFIEKGDSVYLLTDGFADQFGGAKGKKFKYSNLNKLLVGISEFSMDIQKEKLDQEFEKWKGELEQVDDVCIIGIKI